jgi:transcriptional regulator with XRE-family HTH domain
MNIREYREHLGLSLSAFAKSIGVTGSVVCHYEYGKRFPGPAILDKIQRVTGGLVTVSDVLKNYMERKNREV